MASGPPELVRKTVTILFCDVTGFTGLGERVDPETLRRVMLRYFDELATVLGRHGGTVEKFIGDAVMAVFGVPQVHEDDALRAVRAAQEMRTRLGGLNDELEYRWGMRLEERIGINTGEVVTGEGQTLATGDAVNVAARLQQAAQPGEILLGKETYALVSGAVRAGPLESFSVKGRRAQVRTWRLQDVRSSAEQVFRRLGSPLVGRDHEQQLLHRLYRRAIEEQSCQLVTVLGAAGIGKTRLAQEISARLFGATVAQGRCLPYGDGITFFPLVEIVRSLAGVAADDPPARVHARVAELAGGEELIGERLVDVLGLGGVARADESFWAVRKLLESVARERPLVLVLEDVHWAEPTLLDFVEYLLNWSRGAPMLVVCLARSELLETRASWPGERVALEPLDEDEVHTLLGNVLGAAELDPEAARLITEAAEGNPLFVEELVRMLVDDGALRREAGRWVAAGDLDALSIPPTINAVLSARLDRLDPDERSVLQCASVVGKQFWWSAVTELASPGLRPDVAGHLHALVRKRLIFPAEATTFAGEDSFRFGHILVRDAAYAALPKARRAELHERFAGWLEQRGLYEELRGHHLEQAYLAKVELGPGDTDAEALGRQAGALLASAGHRAFAREDMPAAARLLQRALALPTQGAERRETMRELSAALWVVGAHDEADRVLEQLLTELDTADDPRTEWYARLDRAGRRRDAAELDATARRALEVFVGLGDDLGIARAGRRLAAAAARRGAFAEAQDESERAFAHALAAGSRPEQARLADALCTALFYGPAPAAQAIERCEELLVDAGGNLLLEANVLCSLAGLRAMTGRLGEARGAYQRARSLYEELGLQLLVAALSAMSGSIELLAGNAAAAEHELRVGLDILGESRHGDAVAHRAALLSLALSAQGRTQEAGQVLGPAAPTSLTACIVHLIACGRVRGDVAFARSAVAAAADTDALNLEADARATLADLASGSEAAEQRAAALELYERKGNVVSARALAVSPV